MSRYIDLEAFDDWHDDGYDLYASYEALHNAPSIDIVRCKECRHSFINENHPQKPRICGLTKMCGTTKDDWFCADGEGEGER